MRRALHIALFTIMLGALAPCMELHAQEKSDSTKMTKEEALETLRRIESRPFGRRVRELRGKMLDWLLMSDLDTRDCGGLDHLLASANSYIGFDLMVQIPLSSARFILEHPDSAANTLAVRRAGVRGALALYEAHRRATPRFAVDDLDALLKARDNGTLDGVIVEATRGCR